MSTLLSFWGFVWPWLAVTGLMLAADWLGTRFQWHKRPRGDR